MDTGTAAGKALLDMLGVFAEFETNLRRERQLEGIKAAKAKGAYKGRKPTIDAAELRRLRDEERLGPAATARRLRHRTRQRLSRAGWLQCDYGRGAMGDAPTTASIEPSSTMGKS